MHLYRTIILFYEIVINVYFFRKPFLIITTNARSRDSERFEHAQINPIDHFRTQQEQSERINERLSGRSVCSERSDAG